MPRHRPRTLSSGGAGRAEKILLHDGMEWHMGPEGGKDAGESLPDVSHHLHHFDLDCVPRRHHAAQGCHLVLVAVIAAQTQVVAHLRQPGQAIPCRILHGTSTRRTH